MHCFNLAFIILVAYAGGHHCCVHTLGVLIIIIIVQFIEFKNDTNRLMHLSPRRECPGTGMGRHLKSTRLGITKVGGYASLNKRVFSWLLKPSIVC